MSKTVKLDVYHDQHGYTAVVPHGDPAPATAGVLHGTVEIERTGVVYGDESEVARDVRERAIAAAGECPV